MVSKVASMEDGSHLSFEQEHDSAWTVASIHKNNWDSFFFGLVKINPVFLVHLKSDLKEYEIWRLKMFTYDKVFEMWKLIANQNFADLWGIDFAVIPRRVQSHNMICVTMTQEKAILSKIVPHELKIVYTNVRVRNVTHLFYRFKKVLISLCLSF